MANFDDIFERVIENEGGFILHTVAGDPGGMTFAGIARNKNPKWSGWSLIDQGFRDRETLEGQVKNFYLAAFWVPVRGTDIVSREVAFSLVDFAINAGTRAAIIAAQEAAGVLADGKLGPRTLTRINVTTSERMLERLALAKIKHYATICNADLSRKRSKFLLGWINRSLEAVEI